jgi:hypothetical protein
MTTSEGSAPEHTPGPRDGGDDNNWVLDFGRGLGYVTRSVVASIDRLWQSVETEVASPRAQTRGQGARDHEQLDAMLRRLGELVSAHAARGYTSLKEDEAFARLLTRLDHALQREGRARRVRAILARRRARSSGASRPPGQVAPEAVHEAAREAVLEDPGAGSPPPAAESSATDEDPLANVLAGSTVDEAGDATADEAGDATADEAGDAPADEAGDASADEAKKSKRGKAGSKED